MMQRLRGMMTVFSMLAMASLAQGQRIDYQVPYYPGGPTIDGTVTPEEMAAQMTKFMGWDEIEETGGSLVVANSGFEHENSNQPYGQQEFPVSQTDQAPEQAAKGQDIQ